MKRGNIKLLILLAIFILIALLTKFLKIDKSDRNFEKILTNFNEEKVTSIKIVNLSANKNTLLSLNNGVWQVELNGKKYDTDPKKTKEAIKALSNVEALRLISNNDAKNVEYQLTDSLGLFVTAYEGDNILAEIVIGKVNFDNSGGQGSQQNFGGNTYVRKKNQNQIYEIKGFLGFNFDKSEVEWRNKTIIQSNINEIIKIVSKGEFTNLEIENKDNKWKCNNPINTSIDSLKTSQLVTGLGNIEGNNIENNFIESAYTLYQTLEFHTIDKKIIEVKIFRSNSVQDYYVIKSSLNPNNLISSGIDGIVKNLLFNLENIR